MKGVDWVGDVPDKPRVEIDMRRRWSWTAAVVMGPGKGAVGAPDVLLDRPKMLVKVWVVKEPRRGFGDSFGEFSLLADMMIWFCLKDGAACVISDLRTRAVVEERVFQ